MCHLLLLMPLVALPLFWLLPIAIAAPIYGGIVVLSAWLYIFVFKALSRPIVSGKEEILHSTGEVVDVNDHEVHVRIHNELWNTESSDTLRPGGRVKVIDMENLILKVKKIPTNII